MKRALPSISAIFLLILLLISAYSGTFRSPPILDDYHSFIRQQNVYLEELSLSSLVLLAQTVFGWARWIPMVSFSIDHWIGKGDVFFFHLTNTLIHSFCLLAIIFLVRNLLEANPRKDTSSDCLPKVMVAVLVAGLWALHPVQTNAVTYLVQRMASIQALFYILSISFYIMGRRTHIQKKSPGIASLCYTACFIAAVAAFLSKENSAMLPAMILVTEVWFFSPNLHSAIWKRLLHGGKVGRCLLLFLTLSCIFLSFKMGQDLAAGYVGRHFTMLERVLTETRIIAWYMTLLLWPDPSRMSIEHDVVVSTSLINPPTTLLSIIFLILLTWLTIRYRKKHPLMSYGVAWFLLNLLIESSVVPLELIFEHRLYLPSVGFFLSLTCLLLGVLRLLLARFTEPDFKTIACCFFALLISVLSLLTFMRNESWNDSISIYQDAVFKAPNNARAHANLAVAYGIAGHYEQSMSEAELAIAVGQKHHEQWVTAANAILGSLNGLGRHCEAVERGEQLLQQIPSTFNGEFMPNFHLNLAEGDLKCGQLEKAYASTTRALEWTQQKRRDLVDLKLIQGMFVLILQESAKTLVDLNQDGASDPGESSVKTWVAREFLQRGEREEARKLLTLASNENPDDLVAVRLLEGINKEDALNYAQTIKENTKDKYLSSPFSRFNACMALAYLIRTPNRSAPLPKMGEKLLDYALEMQPEVAEAQLLKGYYLHDRKEIKSAVEAARRALVLDPDYAKAYLALGYFLMDLNEFPAAVAAFHKGLELYPACPQRQAVRDLIANIEQLSLINSSKPRINSNPP